MKKIAVINGPNLNLLGERETDIYGDLSLEKINALIYERFPDIDFIFAQSNSEGEIIDEIQKVRKECTGIVINPGAYSHYSIAIRDAIASIDIPVVEAHLSNIYSREAFRSHSVTGAVCKGVISGFGKESYLLAIQALIDMTEK